MYNKNERKRFDMKKLTAILLCALLLLTAAACSAKKPEDVPAPVAETTPEGGETDAEPEPIAEPLAGGWTVAEDTSVTDELRAIFEKGMKELVGVDYVPIALLGTQVMAGTNYCFLAQATVVYPGATSTYVRVYLYADLSGSVSMLRTEPMPIIANGDGTLSVPAAPGTLMGGWAYESDPAVTDEMKARLEKALSETVGAEYEPIANLGTQVVAGLNRCLLCKVTPVVPNAVPHYALVYVYEDLEGGATLNNVVDFGIEMPEGEPEAEAVPGWDNEPIELPEMPNTDEPIAAVAGGWQVSYEPEMTEALSVVFSKALEELVGVDYEPIACLGTQVVAGTNYCFLAKATVVYPGALPKLVLVYVYEDFSGNATLMNIADMPVIPNEYGTAEPIPEEETLEGGWAYAESPEITDEIRDAFGKALNSYGYLAVYEPVANLGTQVVAGLNRCLLVRFTERIPEALPQYKLMYVYEALDGTAEITDVIDFDFGALCTYGA